MDASYIDYIDILSNRKRGRIDYRLPAYLDDTFVSLHAITWFVSLNVDNSDIFLPQYFIRTKQLYWREIQEY